MKVAEILKTKLTRESSRTAAERAVASSKEPRARWQDGGNVISEDEQSPEAFPYPGSARSACTKVLK